MSCRNCNRSKAQSSVHRSKSAAAQEALAIGLPQCYECARKHLSRAKEEFKEFHTGYPTHIKNLILSMRVAETEVRKAYLAWCEIQAQLDMGAGELLGTDANGVHMWDTHVDLANAIRNERVKLSADPLYVPNFDELLVRLQVITYMEV